MTLLQSPHPQGAEHLQPFFYDTVATWTRPLGKSRLRRPPKADVPVRLHRPEGRRCVSSHRVSTFLNVHKRII